MLKPKAAFLLACSPVSLTEILITWVLFWRDCDSDGQETIAGSQICVIKGLGTAAMEGFQQY